MEQGTSVFENYTDQEKGAYLGAIASLATADRHASPEELDFLKELANSMDISQEQEQIILSAAGDPANNSLRQHLEVLKNSELRYSLITDIIGFAKADGSYSSEEEVKIQQMASYLNIDQPKLAAINQLVDTVGHSGNQVQDLSNPNFLNSSGLGNVFSKAGFSSSALTSILALVGPMLLGRMMGRRGGMGAGMGGLGGGMGGLGGGLLGGLGSVLAGGMMGGGQRTGGLGSIFSMLNGSRGYSGGIGSVLGSLFGRR